MELEKGIDQEQGLSAGINTTPIDPEVIGNVERSTPEEDRDLYNEMEKPEYSVQIQKREPIAIGVPFDELGYSTWAIHMLAERFVRPNDLFISTESTYVVYARNFIHDAFLESDQEFLMMIDSDVLLPRNAIAQLLKLAHENPGSLTAGWYFKKSKDGTVRPAVYKFWQGEDKAMNFTMPEIEKLYKKRSVKRVAAVATGAVLMPKSVAEALGESPYTQGRGMGEDLDMCRQLGDMKIDINVFFPIWCRHLGVGII